MRRHTHPKLLTVEVIDEKRLANLLVVVIIRQAFVGTVLLLSN